MDNKETARTLMDFAILTKRLIRKFNTYKYDTRLTVEQFRTLTALNSKERITLKELSQTIEVSTSSICIMLNRLSDENLVYRETDENDRRNTFYGLTEEGKKLLERENEKMLEELGKHLEFLTPEAKDILNRNLREVEPILDKFFKTL
ncbi:MarR family winged helix-turn-helix transcriptional regulator [Clostridium sp. 'White wine YQ']|uniref:MarR family winged helix-turn-helix transcriptional regulator n=1 Tax=Clostridium sp. 'White wine YQ' TaxID=3027474 RepID=UPI002366444D|nr:MarR family transcriptional regulator [Clostridium sp. 'White wine YQ']MDD7795107.1 MarR family transcriptional regulator [Clostridium sp. 'White wine YQ']